MVVDIVVAEIGSTTTVVNAFDGVGGDEPVFVGQGQAATSVVDGDVTIGLNRAIEDLKRKLAVKHFSFEKMMASSSAAGGLRMTVHGLVYDMTAKAAKEAALGAGAIVHTVTAGRLRKSELLKLKEIKPNIILIAGGLDYGERDTAIYNSELIKELMLGIPVIYAGNIENEDEIKDIFSEYNAKLYIAPNVYPKVDLLNVEPTRKIIQQVFEEHIVNAPGMEKVREIVNGTIMPTPGAVMEMAIKLKALLGDLVVIDVGGATTDIHSVTDGSQEINRILLAPEPSAKRTVEGDLGMYVNALNVIRLIGEEKLSKELDIDISKIMETLQPLPVTNEDIHLIERLCEEAVVVSMKRHAGRVRKLYGSSGGGVVAEGKDLSEVKYIIGTGGALTRLPRRIEIIKKISIKARVDELFPKAEAQILVDNDYIMASLGVLSKEYPEGAIRLMKKSLCI